MTSEKAILEAIDGYKDTVSFMLALLHELTWNESAKAPENGVAHAHGTKQKRTKSSDSEVTPDLAFLVRDECGVIGDVKISFASDARGRDKIREQLSKYDEVLGIWCGGNGALKRCAKGSLILLTHHTRKVDAEDYFSAEAKAKRFTPTSPFAIVAGVRTSQREEYITLERSYGTIALPRKDEKLRKTVAIRLDHLSARFVGVRFYDAEPPLAYLLETIWDAVLPTMIPEESFADATKGVKLEAQVTGDQVAQLLRDNFSLRTLDKSLPGAPQSDAVSKALDAMVTFGLGQKTKAGTYKFHYRKLRGGTLAFFIKKLLPAAKKKAAPVPKSQLPLFPTPGPRRIAKPVPPPKS